MGPASYHCLGSQHEESQDAQQGNGAGEEGGCGYQHVQEARPVGCWVLGAEETRHKSTTQAAKETRILEK